MSCMVQHVSPCPRPQHAARDPFLGLRRTAVCIFSLYLTFVALSSLDIFKSDDSLVEPTSPKLGETLLLRPLAPIHAAGNAPSAFINIKLKPSTVDHSLLDSDKSAGQGQQRQSLAMELRVKTVADQDEEVQRQIDAVLSKATAVSVKQAPPLMLKKQGGKAVVVPSAPPAPKMAPLSKETREAMQAGEEAGREADEAAKARAQVEAAENYRQLRKAMYAEEREEERKERESRDSQKGLTISQDNDELLKDLDSVYANDPTAKTLHIAPTAATAVNATGLDRPKPKPLTRHGAPAHPTPPVRESRPQRPALPRPVALPHPIAKLPIRHTVQAVPVAHPSRWIRPVKAQVRPDAQAEAEVLPSASAVAVESPETRRARAVPIVGKASEPSVSQDGLAGIVSQWLKAL